MTAASEPASKHQTNQSLLTPTDVAQELRVTAEQVRSLIRKGELSAVNIGTGQKRPLYRISRQALDEFLSRRWRPQQANRRRRTRARMPVPDQFPHLR